MKRIIYQVLPRLWGNGRMSAWKKSSFDYMRSLGVDYIWFTGIPRHATGKDFVKGDPGSMYAITDWTDVNPYLADDPDKRMEEFDLLVKRVHKAGFKMLIDYIPNHVAVDYGGAIAHHNWCDGDWTDTLKNNWDDPRTYDEMLRVLRFWASKGVDGFRCDMVELVPPHCLKGLIETLKSEYPGLIFIAEAYQKDNYRCYTDYVGFDLLYDKSGLYDTLRAICDHKITAQHITWNWQWLGDLQPRMLNFLENHDEQRMAAPEFLGDVERSFAPLATSLLFNDASFMLYFGQEVGEDAAEGAAGRTSIFNWCKPESISALNAMVHKKKALDPRREGILARYRELLSYAALPVFRNGSCWDLCYCNNWSYGFNSDRHFAFVRFDEECAYLVVCNFDSCNADMEIAIPAEIQDKCNCGTVSISVNAGDAAIVKF